MQTKTASNEDNMAEKKVINVGGQAVIEGVMMRGADNLSTAVRRKDGTIELYRQEFISITSRNKILGLPVVRGFVSLVEMMIIGFQTLTFSANRFELDLETPEGKESKTKTKTAQKTEEAFSFIIAMGLAFLLFGLLPYKLSDWLGLSKQDFYFNLFAGSIRIVFFVLYVWLISFMKDIKRLFRYHGAEHKNVLAFERGLPLEVPIIQEQTTIHPRCGTSFMFLVLLIAILIFSVTDTLVSAFILKAPVPTLLRLAYHLLMLPLVSGLSYEVLKFSAKNSGSLLVRFFVAPGMALQKITTQPPDDEMVETALVAMKSALDMDLSAHKVRILETPNDPA